MRRTIVSFVSVAVLVLLSVLPAHAENEYAGWRFRVWAGITGRFVETDNATFTDETFGESATEVNGTGFGIGIDAERRFSKLLGLDLAVGYTEFDVEFTQSLTTTTAKDTLDVLPIMLALNFHVVNTEKLDFWLGPQIGYVMWNDPLTFTASGQPDFVLETEDTFGLGMVTQSHEITGETKDILYTQNRGAEQVRLQRDAIAVTTGHLKDRFQSLLPKEAAAGDRQPVNPASLPSFAGR